MMKLTHKFIHKILEDEDKNSSVLLSGCVLTISDRKRELVFLLFDDVDSDSKDIEILYADNHETKYNGVVNTEEELKELVLEHFKSD